MPLEENCRKNIIFTFIFWKFDKWRVMHLTLKSTRFDSNPSQTQTKQKSIVFSSFKNVVHRENVEAVR